VLVVFQLARKPNEVDAPAARLPLYITVYPDGIAKPTVSNLNFTRGQAIPNTVIVKVSADGYIDLTNGSGGTVNLITDIFGFYN
jgi:hypothetical protein